MEIGKLDTRITIQRRATMTDAWGQPTETWADVALVWANVRHLNGIESIKAGADVSVVRSSFRIRHRTGIDAGMRIVSDGSTYDIEAALPGGRREWLDLAAKRVT